MLLFRNRLIIMLLLSLIFFETDIVDAKSYGGDGKKETITIAALVPLSGIASVDGLSILSGIQIAADEINSKGGLLNQRLKIITIDNKSTAIGSRDAAMKAVQANVSGIFGPSWSSHAIAAAEIAQQYGIPMINHIATNPNVTLTGDYIFRVCFTDAYQGKTLAEFAFNDLNAETAVVMTNVSNDYSIGLSQYFITFFSEMGGAILKKFNYIQKETHFYESIKFIKEHHPDVVFIPGHYESGMIAKELYLSRAGAILMGGDGWSADFFFRKGGNVIPIGYYTTHWSKESDNEKLISFLNKYGNYDNINYETVLSYDAVMLFADAVIRAGSNEKSKIKRALSNTVSFQGLSGNMSMDKNGDPKKSIVIMKIEKGEAHYLKTVTP